jgi:hypothetical protein
MQFPTKVTNVFHRIYPKPFTRINEAWNFDGRLDSSQKQTYSDHRIVGDNTAMVVDRTLFCDFYKYFAIDIVSETVYNYPYPCITEKTMRPIVHKRMFIILGPPSTLARIQDKGFQTFAPFINEEYDTIQDPHRRMQAIVEELTRISKFSIDDIRETMLQYKSILQHNYDHYVWLCNHEIEQIVDNL